ncbi:MAG: protein kinase [Bacteroidota bacterium]
MPVFSPKSIFAGRYLLTNHLGTGGFSEVWKAVDQMANNAVVVVKVFLPGRGMDASGVQLFSKEYSMVLNLDHPHLLTALHFDVYNGSPYLILPYCEGGNLYSRLQAQGPFEEREVAEIAVQVADALAHLHDNQIIHQDIKPDNILIKSLGKYVLSDFGISFQLKRTLNQTLTGAAHSKYYTPYYAPPEKNLQKPDFPGDIFSLGVMMYELANGEPPFEFTGKSLMEGAEIEPIPHISEQLNQILEACMSIDPEMRPTAHKMQFWAGYYLETGGWGVLKRKQPKKKKKRKPKIPKAVEQKKAAPKTKKEKSSPKNLSPKKIKLASLKSQRVLWGLAGALLLGSIGIGMGASSIKGLFEEKTAYVGGLNSAGLPNGEGSVTYENGDHYEGSWLNGLKHGKGKMTYANGDVFEGEYQKGFKQGQGTFTYANKDRYEGEFKKGKKDGQGVYIYGDGQRFIGTFQNDVIEGPGRYLDAEGKIIAEGRWEKGEYIGPVDPGGSDLPELPE